MSTETVISELCCAQDVEEGTAHKPGTWVCDGQPCLHCLRCGAYLTPTCPTIKLRTPAKKSA